MSAACGEQPLDGPPAHGLDLAHRKKHGLFHERGIEIQAVDRERRVAERADRLAQFRLVEWRAAGWLQRGLAVDADAMVIVVADGQGQRGVDAAFDLVGDAMKKMCLRSLGYDGRVMSIVEEESPDFELDIWRPAVSPLWPRSGSFTYVAMSARARSPNPGDWHVYPEMWQALTGLIESGGLSPPRVTVVGELGGETLAQAHTRLATGHVKGKLVLTVGA